MKSKATKKPTKKTKLKAKKKARKSSRGAPRAASMAKLILMPEKWAASALGISYQSWISS
jgi:hypothetical protein